MNKEEIKKVWEFDPVIYPFRLWVMKKPTYKDFSDNFFELDSDYNTHEVQETVYENLVKKSYAFTYTVARKPNKQIGAFVALLDISKVTAPIIAHEASHVVDFINEHCGLESNTYQTGETRAYLIAWVVDCINKVKRGVV